jgi:hypothetical protein
VRRLPQPPNVQPDGVPIRKAALGQPARLSKRDNRTEQLLFDAAPALTMDLIKRNGFRAGRELPY